MCKIFYVRQLEPKGLGHAILCAKEFINNEPFAVLLGDDLMVNEKPVLKQLIEKFNETNCSILGAQTVPKKDVCKYGNITPNSEMNNRTVEVKDLVEKPKVEEAVKSGIEEICIITNSTKHIMENHFDYNFE